MSIEIKKMSDIQKDQGIKILIHGPTNSGKTYSLRTLPNHDKCIVISAEGGLIRVAEECKTMNAIEVKSIDDMREVHSYIKEHHDLYDTIVMDSGTDIAERSLEEHLGKKTTDGNKAHGMQAYGNTQDEIIKMMKSFRDLTNKNVLIICQQEKLIVEEHGLFYGPSMPGKKLANKLPYLFDLVGCMRMRTNEKGEIERRIQFHAEETYICKDRTGKLNQYEEVDWSIIFNKIKGN